MQYALMFIRLKKGDVTAGTCFDPVDGDQLNELQSMNACRDATGDEIAIHERRSKPAKKRAAPAKKAEPKGDDGAASAASKKAAPKGKAKGLLGE